MTHKVDVHVHVHHHKKHKKSTKKTHHKKKHHHHHEVVHPHKIHAYNPLASTAFTSGNGGVFPTSGGTIPVPGSMNNINRGEYQMEPYIKQESATDKLAKLALIAREADAHERHEEYKSNGNRKPALLTNGPTTINHYHTLNGEPLVPTHNEEEQQKTENVKQTLHDKTHGKIQKPTHSGIKPKAELLNMSEEALKKYINENHPDQSEDTATKFGLGKKDKKTKPLIDKAQNPNDLNSAFQIPVSEPTNASINDFIEPVAAATEKPIAAAATEENDFDYGIDKPEEDFDHDSKAIQLEEEPLFKDAVSSTVDAHRINHVKKETEEETLKAAELNAEKRLKKAEKAKQKAEESKAAEAQVVVKNKVGRPSKAEAAAKAAEIVKKNMEMLKGYKLRGSKKDK